MTNDPYKIGNALRRFLLVLIILIVPGLCLWPNTSSSQSPVKIMKVIVDPGHGGQDTGGRGSDGVLEKDVTLALARKLDQMLGESGTIRSVLTRRDDYAVSLEDRAGLANHRRGDLLISLHLGNSFRPVPLGFSLYYWSPALAVPFVSSTPGETIPWDQEQQ